MRRIVVIPAYNEEKTVSEAVRGALALADLVVVVDDGSTDRTAEVAGTAGATVVRHAINRGLGGALGTGIAAALRLGADALVTMDADGQHRPEDARRVFDRLERGGVDFVIGSRMLEARGHMPRRRRLAQWCGNALTAALFGRWVSDSQSGLRGLTRPAAERLELKSSRMEVSSEFIREAARLGLRVAEIPIESVYTDYSLSKGQGFAVGLQTAARLILRRLID